MKVSLFASSEITRSLDLANVDTVVSQSNSSITCERSKPQARDRGWVDQDSISRLEFLLRSAASLPDICSDSNAEKDAQAKGRILHDLRTNDSVSIWDQERIFDGGDL